MCETLTNARSHIASIAGYVSGIFACLMLFVKPVREKILGTEKIIDGQRCLLRSSMLQTYYRHADTETIRQYEYENFIKEYDAYKALNGNSFIDDIYKEVRTWKILT